MKKKYIICLITFLIITFLSLNISFAFDFVEIKYGPRGDGNIVCFKIPKDAVTDESGSRKTIEAILKDNKYNDAVNGYFNGIFICNAFLYRPYIHAIRIAFDNMPDPNEIQRIKETIKNTKNNKEDIKNAGIKESELGKDIGNEQYLHCMMQLASISTNPEDLDWYISLNDTILKKYRIDNKYYILTKGTYNNAPFYRYFLFYNYYPGVGKNQLIVDIDLTDLKYEALAKQILDSFRPYK
jgi:hypothetical protein